MGTTRRIAARVRRGETFRQLSLAGRPLLPPPEPGNVWTGFRLGRPRQARNLADDDLHAERQRALDAVLTAVAPAACILAPPVARHPWRLAVRDQDASAVLQSLFQLPAHWEIREERHPRRITARPRLAAGGRPLPQIPDLEVVLDVLRHDDGQYTGDAVGTFARVDAEDWDAQSMRSLQTEGRLLSAPAPSMPIDLVYTWVDGADPRWRERRDAALRAQGSAGARAHDSAVDESRYLDSEELRYSLRSVHRYASWVRRIHLVTDGQLPHWLVPGHPLINVVDHQTLLGGSRFNSHAIESALHRIPGLAEHYLYLNDDVFFGRIAYPEDFFAAPGISRFFPSDLPIDPGPATGEDLPLMAAAKNGRDLISARFDLEVRTKLRHTVHPQQRAVAEQIEAEHPAEVAATRSALFRSATDLSLASSLHHWYAYALRRAVPAQPNYLYVNLASPQVGQTLDALESLRRYDTFCLNQEQAPASAATRHELSTHLRRYLPTPAPWERPEQRS